MISDMFLYLIMLDLLKENWVLHGILQVFNSLFHKSWVCASQH